MLKYFVFILALISFLPAAQATGQTQQLSGKELEDAKKMNDIYGRHMFSSTCVENQKLTSHGLEKLPAAEQATEMAEFKKKCDCLTNTLLKEFTPNDLIDYVGFMSGSFPPGAKPRPKADPLVAAKRTKISDITREVRDRQQCGFKRVIK